MNPMLIPILGEGVRRVLDSLFPDPVKRAEAEAQLRLLEQSGTFEQRAALQLATLQAEINKVEAGTDKFRGGWRPAAGWVCVAALGAHYVAFPVTSWALQVAGVQVPALPSLDGMLMELLFALLGLTGFRSLEKIKGKA